jgi:hypothetical protein
MQVFIYCKMTLHVSGVYRTQQYAGVYLLQKLLYMFRVSIAPNSMQVFIYCKITLHVSGVHRTHHQEYIKL